MKSGTADRHPSLPVPGAAIAGIAGVLWPLLAFIRIPLTDALDQPIWTDDRDTIVSFYRDSEFDVAFAAGMALVVIAYLLLLVFLAKTALLIGGWLGALVVSGGVLDVGVGMAYLAPYCVAIFWASHGGLDADSYLALHGLSFAFLWLDLIVISAWLAPLGLAIILTGLFPKWLGWAMVINVVASLVAFFLPYPAWTIVGGLPYLWVLIAATVMLRWADRYERHVSKLA